MGEQVFIRLRGVSVNAFLGVVLGASYASGIGGLAGNQVRGLVWAFFPYVSCFYRSGMCLMLWPYEAYPVGWVDITSPVTVQDLTIGLVHTLSLSLPIDTLFK